MSVDEVITLVNLALSGGSVAECESGDGDGNGSITVDEIVIAVTHALTGRPASATATASATPTVMPTADPELAFMPDAEFESRKAALLEAATVRLRPDSMTSELAHLERDATDPAWEAPAGAVPADARDAVFTKVANLKDASDFDVLMLINALYRFDGHPMVHPEIWQRAEEAVLGFKYWYTQAGPEGVVDHMWYWTENHLIMFHTIEYLAGQRYPERRFTHTGMNGAEHRAVARERLLDWFDLRARFGFSEFLASTTALDSPDADDGPAVLFALSSRYRVPRVLQEIAAAPDPFANRRRRGIFFDKFERGAAS